MARTAPPLSVRAVDVIRRLAHEAGATQTDLGKRSGIGQPQVSRLFAGRAQLKVDELDVLSRALGATAVEVLERAGA